MICGLIAMFPWEYISDRLYSDVIFDETETISHNI